MATYAIGDVHGCFTQFMELKNKVEKVDANARFILLGDIVGRGPEDEKMLEWVYNNVTLDGKYQMVRGNHDDTFIEMFGKAEFDTIYSVSRQCRRSAFPDEKEFAHLTDLELMYKYAAFLAQLPLVKQVETGGKKFAIAHAWIENQQKSESSSRKFESEAEAIADAKYWEFHTNLWDRDIKYDGSFEMEYQPRAGELLVHGHTPTIRPKVEIHRGHGVGKVWKLATSVNVDCGLVFSVTKHREEASIYGNLAAYCLETGEATYLWEIEDPYLTNDEEYYEDKQERLVREAEIAKQKRTAAKIKFKPYTDSFEAHLVNEQLLTAVPTEDDRQGISYNFLNDHFMEIYTDDTRYRKKEYDFDFEKELPLALFGERYHRPTHLFLYENSHWYGVKLAKEMIYQLFKYQDEYLLLGVSKLGFFNQRVIISQFARERMVVDVTLRDFPRYEHQKADDILAGDVKLTKDYKYLDHYLEARDSPRLTGLMTCDVYLNRNLLTLKMLKMYDDVSIVRLVTRDGEILTELSQIY